MNRLFAWTFAISAAALAVTMTVGIPGLGGIPILVGAIALVAMAASLVLAARWSPIDWAAGGPDKAYRLHRWFGYAAFVGLVAHWMIGDAGGTSVETALSDLSEGLGTLAAFGIVTLVVVSVLRVVPYHIWKYSHYLMGPMFLLAAFHTVTMIPAAAVGSVGWFAAIAVSAIGALAWLATLVAHIVRPAAYEVVSVSTAHRATDIRLRPKGRAIRHKVGQYAEISFDRDGLHEFHPFTIASAPGNDLRFVMRELGDFTKAVPRDIAVGDTVHVRRVRGRFRPQTAPGRPHQVWLAGGVGITPFLAAVSAMEADKGAAVDLVMCVRSESDAIALDELRARAAALPQLRLHLLQADRGEYADAATLAPILEGVDRRARLLMCGPEGMKTNAAAALHDLGFTRRPDDEDFDFRSAWCLSHLFGRGGGKFPPRAVHA